MPRARRPYESLIAALRARILEGPGHLDAAVRQAAFDDEPVPDEMASYVAKVRQHAYKVVDADVEALHTDRPAAPMRSSPRGSPNRCTRTDG